MAPSEPDRIDAYLDEVTRALPAGRRARRAIRAELDDGQECAVDARLARGAAPAEATAAALAEFGPPGVVARAFARELLLGAQLGTAPTGWTALAAAASAARLTAAALAWRRVARLRAAAS